MITMAALDACEKQRETRQRTNKNRLTFDCFYCHVKPTDPDRAYCQKGHLLGAAENGTMLTGAVLRGRTARVCQLCLDFDG